MFLHRLGRVRAPEFPHDLTWIGSEPKTLKSLIKKPVLIDFWTYSCVNCIRTTPHLNRWHKDYAKKGLAIIGVHTPEFAFEKDEANVKKAVKEFGIKYPVVLDSDYQIWNLYTNRWWPRKFLIDADGYIVYDHVGEGGYEETEMAIQQALQATGVKDLPKIAHIESPGGGICYRPTPETYLGFIRGRYGNREMIRVNEEHAFTDVPEHLDHVPYLHGHWRVGAESVAHTKKLATSNEYLLLKYSSYSVNLVMGLTAGKSAEVELELDGRPLPEDMAGADVEVKNGKALLTIKSHRMYRLISASMFHKGTLKIKTAAENIEMFAFTFGGCLE